MPRGLLGKTKVQAFLGKNKLKYMFIGNVKVYSAGSTCVYHIDTDKVTEPIEYDEGQDCCSYIPEAKTGWTFVGWREDTTATPTVLEHKIMSDTPIQLYAVYSQAIKVTYYDNSTSPSYTNPQNRIYNNGNIINPTFNLTQKTSAGWNSLGWSTTNKGDAAITYKNGTDFIIDKDITLYGLYNRTLTLTYYDNSTTAKTKTGTNYWAPAGHIYPTITKLTQTDDPNWTERGWSKTNNGNANIDYANGANIELRDNLILYGLYQQTVTINLNNNATISKQTGTRYWAPKTTDPYIHPSFKFSEAGVTDWTPIGWSTNNNTDNTTTYGNNTSFTVTTGTSLNLYSKYSRTFSITYNSNGGTGTTGATTGTGYRNASGTISYPSLKVASCNFSKTDNLFYRWRTGTSSGDIYTVGSIYNKGNLSLYAYWVQKTSKTFTYTGTDQTFSVLAGVTYLLKVWGAQGGGDTTSEHWGGKGGYAYGYYTPTVNETLHITVGGQGSKGLDDWANGGYNGGGKAYSNHGGMWSSGGGGATHISTTGGLLNNPTVRSGCKIAAGGGGGYVGYTYTTYGGIGGGNTGGGSSEIFWGTGGTQTSAGGQSNGDGTISPGNGGPGTGGYATSASGWTAGGGGGWYGGGAAGRGAGGGSGYIGGVKNGGWGNSSDLQTGNGKAEISVYSIS